jgi:3D (Asp-Asp-Asp) domain-containing protein
MIDWRVREVEMRRLAELGAALGLCIALGFSSWGCEGEIDERAPQTHWDEGTSWGVLSGAAVASGTALDGVALTHYIVVAEADTSGQKTGDSTVLCDVPNLTGCYHKEFLCSGYGVAMQGTGIASNGKYVKWVSGGGGWWSNYLWLNDCGSAVFSHPSGVTGALGVPLTPDWSVATDPGLIPLGWYIWIESEKHWFRAEDTGGAILGKHLDLYYGSTGKTPKASSSTIYVTHEVKSKYSPSPFGGAIGITAAPGSLAPGGWSAAGGASVALSWSSVSGAYGYDVYVRLWSGGSWVHYYRFDATGNSVTFTPAVSDAWYAFAVRGRAGESTGPLSAWSAFRYEP